MALPATARAEDFAVFDGRVYNGRFYPRIDIIEWGKPSHMEFHIYSKTMPIDLAFELETKTGKPVMLVRYTIKDRNEVLCRRVLAPSHFKAGTEFFVYKDMSDHEMDNIIVSAAPLPDKPGMVALKTPKYNSCDAGPSERLPASNDGPAANPVQTDDAAAHGETPAKTSELSPGGAFLKW